MLATMTALTHLEYLLAAALVLFLPGLAWQAWLSPDERDPLERLADALGISVGLTALVGLAAFLLGLHFTAGWLIGLYTAFLLTWVVGSLRSLRSGQFGCGWRAALPGLGDGALLLAALAWRLYQARGLLLPAWVDSVHHTLVVNLFLQNGGIPASFDPYFPVEFTYHYGFHLLAALFSAVTGASAEQGVLWFGQALNAAVALAVYRLGRAAWRDWRAAALAALLVAFTFQMPAYYVTWGRYTLLTGLAVLPAAMAAALELSRQPQRLELSIRLAVLTAGVALSHYTALLLLLLFLLVLGAGLFFRRAWRGLWTTAAASLLGALLAAPWLLRSWNALSYHAGVGVVSPLDGSQAGYWEYILYLVGPDYNYILYLAALAALLWLLVRGPVPELPVWGLLMGLLMLPWGLRLAPFRPDHLAILVFLPAALLLGGALARLAGMLAKWRPRLGGLVLLLAALALTGLGLARTRDVVNPVTVLVNAADLQALDWVQENTPPGARFFINTTGWQGSYRGVDGGYWLMTLTGRQTVTPPALAWMGNGDFQTQLNLRAGLASQAAGCDERFWQVVADADLNYAYIKEGAGLLQPAALSNCPGVVNVYRRDGVYIYEIVR